MVNDKPRGMTCSLFKEVESDLGVNILAHSGDSRVVDFVGAFHRLHGR